MKVWRLREVDPKQGYFFHPEADGHVYFRKDKMTKGTGVIYLSYESAQRGLRGANPPEGYSYGRRYEVVEFVLAEVIDD